MIEAPSDDDWIAAFGIPNAGTVLTAATINQAIAKVADRYDEVSERTVFVVVNSFGNFLVKHSLILGFHVRTIELDESGTWNFDWDVQSPPFRESR